MRSIKRYVIPIDGKPHQYKMVYDPLYAAPGITRDELYFWAEEDDCTEYTVTLMVAETGVPIPDDALWLATIPKKAAGEAWHLLQLGPEDHWHLPSLVPDPDGE